MAAAAAAAAAAFRNIPPVKREGAAARKLNCGELAAILQGCGPDPP